MTIFYGSQANDPAVQPQPVLVERRKPRSMRSNKQVPVGATVADTLVFGRIPSNCKIDPASILRFGALTGVTSFDLGLYAESAPWVADTSKGAAACLISALDIHLAGTKDYSAVITPDLAEKFAWEIAGLSADPGGFLLVVGTIHSGGGTASAAAWLHNKTTYHIS